MTKASETPDDYGTLPGLIAQLIEEIADYKRAVVKLTNTNQIQRKWLIGLGVSVAFDILLSIAVVSGLLGVSHAQDQTHKAQAELQAVIAKQAQQDNFTRVTCLASNEAAKNQHILWDSILTSSSGKGDPQQAARFKATLDKTFAQKQCG